MQKTSAKFQNDWWKTKRSCVHCLYTLIAFHTEQILSSPKQKKWEKIIKGLYPYHMHSFIPCRKHLQSFKTFHGKLRGGVPTRYPVYFHLKVYDRTTEGQGKSSKAPTFSKQECCGQAVIVRAIGTVTGEMLWPSSYSRGHWNCNCWNVVGKQL